MFTIFQEMQNCVEMTGFVFKNVALFVSYPKIQPWKSRLGYVNLFETSVLVCLLNSLSF